MKWFLPLLYSILIMLFFSNIAFANVAQGNSQSTVTTTVEGSGTVSIHMESSVNGNTKTLDANQPGTYTLSNSSDDVQISPSEIPTILTPTTNPQVTLTLTPTPTEKPHKTITTFLPHVQSFFHTFVQKMLAFFHI